MSNDKVLLFLLVLCYLHWVDAFPQNASRNIAAGFHLSKQQPVDRGPKSLVTVQELSTKPLYRNGCTSNPSFKSGSNCKELFASTVSNNDSPFYSNGQNVLLPNRKIQALTMAEREKILQDYRVPSVKDVLTFAVPAVFVWLLVPLTSMITTSCVGLIAGTSQQAALNPAIAVINYSSKSMVRLIFSVGVCYIILPP